MTALAWSLEPVELLALWEAGGAVPPPGRGAALLRSAGLPPADSLGAANAQWLGLHARWFGPVVELLSHCPACATAAEFEVDAQVLAEQLPPADLSMPLQLHCLGHELQFRLPRPDDTAAAAVRADNDEAFARQLLARCITACTHEGAVLAPANLPEAVLDAVSQRIEALDPGAELAFALACPHCGMAWSAALDAGELLWHKLRAAAERLLREVDALARAYGWSEPEVLALSPARRAAYLQMALA